jgi:hypothetical protein
MMVEVGMRRKGSRNRLVTLDYDSIAELAGGITAGTAKRYANRGEYDSRDLESILSWVNSRRQRRGKPLIGMPTDDAPQADSDDETPTRWNAQMADMSGGYDPLTGGYRGLDDNGNR